MEAISRVKYMVSEGPLIKGYPDEERRRGYSVGEQWNPLLSFFHDEMQWHLLFNAKFDISKSGGETVVTSTGVRKPLDRLKLVW